jgi:hypothetical protein
VAGFFGKDTELLRATETGQLLGQVSERFIGDLFTWAVLVFLGQSPRIPPMFKCLGGSPAIPAKFAQCLEDSGV